MSNAPLFVLEGNGSCLNRGCEAILRSTIAILEREFGSSRYVNCSQGERCELDGKVVRLHNLRHMPFRCTNTRFTAAWLRLQVNKRLLKAKTDFPFEPSLDKATAVLGLGGDRMSFDYSVPTLHFQTVETVLKAKRPMVLWGQSIGPFSKDPEFERYAMRILRNVDLVYVRESLTRDYLADHGITHNVHLAADPAFAMDAVPAEMPDEAERLLSQAALGINMSPLLSRFMSDAEGWVRKAAACLKAIDARVDLPLLMIPHVFFKRSDDHAFMRAVLQACPKMKNPVCLMGPNYGARQLKWIISRCSAFVGARTHSTIAALSTCVPTLCLGYSVKSRGINQDIYGHLDWLIRSDELDAEGFAEKVAVLLEGRARLRAQLEARMPAYIASAWQAGHLLREVVGCAQSSETATDRG